MHIGILGGGRMGKDVFDLFSRNDFQVTLFALPLEVETLEQNLFGALRRRAAKSGPRAEAAAKKLAKLKITTKLEDLASCDFISESVPEKLELKRKIHGDLEKIVSPNCILATNSSFITPDLLAEVLEKGERMIGMHFFYPTRLSTFIEVIPGPETSPEVLETTLALVRQMNLRPLQCKNVPGFLVNRMIPAYFHEGMLMLEEGYFTATEIDAIARELVGGIGPLGTSDQIGLDLVAHANHQFPEIWRDGWIIPPLLESLVADGKLGAKSGSGFFNYDNGVARDHSSSLPESPRKHCVPAYSREEAADRLLYTVVIEAYLHLDGELASAEDIDSTLKEVLGLEQGPIKLTHTLGVEAVKEKLATLAERFGRRFQTTGTLA